MIPIAALQCYDAVPSNRDFPLFSMETKDKLKRLWTMPQFDSWYDDLCWNYPTYRTFFIIQGRNEHKHKFSKYLPAYTRTQWPRDLRRRSATARLLRLWVRIPPGAWLSVCWECCVLPGIGLCDELITAPEESYRLWFVVVCDLETSWMRRPWRSEDCCAKKNIYICMYITCCFHLQDAHHFTHNFTFP